MKDLLKYLLTELLGNADFEIDESVTDNGFINLKVTTAPENMGLVIGKKGRIIKALRSVLRTRATLDKIGFSLEVTEK